jgi:lipoteichoic acid synthase
MAVRLGIDLNPGNDFPFKRVEASPGLAAIGAAKPNMIVLFVESLSADLVGIYHERWRSVTPHINRFAEEKGLTIDQYHNHVFPTIVGVRGQLCSNYPSISHTVWDHAKFKLESGAMRCLPHVLNEQGYETTFLGYSQPNETYFDDQMEEVGFARRYFYDEFLREFLPDESSPGLGLKGNSDEQMMRGLVGFLRTKETRSSPFFVAVSTLETHPGMDVSDERYAFKGADSAVLNVVHNFDRSLGLFLDYFFASPLAANTMQNRLWPPKKNSK